MTTLNTIQNAFINMQFRGLTVASCLAQQNKIDALEKVIALGAKVEDAIYGAALSGNTELVNKLVGSQPKPGHLGSAIRGYARMGRFKEIYEIPDYKNYLNDRILGSAQGGYDKQIDPWLVKNYSLLSLVVKGYVDAKDSKYLMNILPGTIYYPNAIYHAARSRRTTFVNKLLEECGIKPNLKLNINSEKNQSNIKTEAKLSAFSYLNQAANGYIAGGHYKEAAEMLERGADISLCIDEIGGVYDNLEPYLALYCSISDENIANSLIARLDRRLSINDNKISESTLKTTQGIKELMKKEGICYIAAKSRIENAHNDSLLNESDINLPYLLKVLSRELNFDFDFEVQTELSSKTTTTHFI